MASAPAPHETRYRRLVRLLVIAASFLAFLSIFTTWVDRQALNTDEWVNTSGRLLEDKAISDAVANYAVDQLFASVNVPKLLGQQLPHPVKRFSGPLASGLREFAIRAAGTALQTSRLQAVWRDANRAAHENLLAILENRSNAVSTTNGTVYLDLRPIVGQLASQIGIERQVSQNLPPDVARLQIVRSDQLGTAQTITQLVKGLALVFSLGTLALFGLAAYLAAGRRWLVVFGYGIGLIVSGIAALALRTVGATVVVNGLVHTDAVRTAAEHAYSIGTDLLSSIATTVIAYGVLFVIASYLASPAGGAVALRRTVAPSFRDRPAIVWSIFGGAVLMFLIASPPSSNRELFTTLALIAIAGIGLAALSSKTSHEFPDARSGEWRARVATRFRELSEGGAQRMRTAIGDLGGRDEEDARLERLAKLGELKQKGLLTEEEFTAEKERLLAKTPARTPNEEPTRPE
jgi:putative oligomerization/nucleic acid binding protein